MRCGYLATSVVPLFSIAILSSCGAGSAPVRVDSPPETLQDEERVAAWGASVDELDEELETALETGSGDEPTPDCEEICRLRGQICHLADQICGLRERNPQSEIIRTRCEDASERCVAAEEDTEAVCECGEGEERERTESI